MVWDLLDPKPDPEWEKAPAIPSLPSLPTSLQVPTSVSASLPKLPTWKGNNTEERPKTPKEVVTAASGTDGGAIECDYERNCTRLYKAIEDAIEETEWKPIIKFLDTGYWPGTVFADEISPKQQAMTWVTRFDPNNNTVVKWSQLPLHLAIVCGAPFSVVGRLIELYPQGVRCTDDQRMLPIHLALRHNANDDTVAYLLLQFPESVNAKGKDGRTPIQCALRAESKVRGKILEIFVTKTKSKVKSKLAEGTTDKDKKIQLLETQLEAKTLELNNALSKFEALSNIKAEVEDDMSKKIVSAEKKKAEVEKESSHAIEHLQDQKLVDEIKLQMKIEGLEAEKKKVEEAERKAREEEAALRQDLDSVSKKIESANSPDELEKIKDDVKSLKLGRIEAEKQETKEKLESVVADLDEIAKEEGKNEEIHSMQKEAEEINKAIDNDDDELVSLKSNVDELRAKLKKRDEAVKIVADLTILRAMMEEELKNENTPKDMAASMKDAIKSMDNLEDKSPDELAELKEGLEGIRKDMKKHELVVKTKKAVEDLKESLADKSNADAKEQVEDIEMKLTAENITIDDLLSHKKELAEIKAAVKVEEKASGLREAILDVKKDLESDIEKADSKLSKEIKKAIKPADEKSLEGKSIAYLESLKTDLESLKLKAEMKIESAKAQKELSETRKTMTENQTVWEGRNKQGIADIIKAIDAFNTRSFEDVDSLKGELKTIREDSENASRATKVKKDLDMLKNTLEEALKTADSDSSDELLAMKKAVDSISVDGLAIKNKKQWDAIDEELTALKDDLKTKDIGHDLLQKEIAEMKSEASTSSKHTSSTKKSKSSKKWLKGLLTPFRRSKKAAPLETPAAPTEEHEHEHEEVPTILPPSIPPESLEPKEPAPESTAEEKEVAQEHTDAETDEEHPASEEASGKSKKSISVSGEPAPEEESIPVEEPVSEESASEETSHKEEVSQKSKKSTAESKKSAAESKKSTAESKKSTAESKKSTADKSKKSTADKSKKSTATESKKSTATESKKSTATESKKSSESKKSTAAEDASVSMRSRKSVKSTKSSKSKKAKGSDEQSVVSVAPSRKSTKSSRSKKSVKSGKTKTSKSSSVRSAVDPGTGEIELEAAAEQ